MNMLYFIPLRFFLLCILFINMMSYDLLGALQEKVSKAVDQKSLFVTIYNSNLALVKDSRQVFLDQGKNRLAFREVSAKIKPETSLLKNISHQQGFFIIEQNFDFDLLSPTKLLEKYVGREVQVIKTHPTSGKEIEVLAKVLSSNSGVVLQMNNRIETQIPGRINYPNLPANLRDRPTLVIDLNSPVKGNHELELSYLTGGLSWKADYVGELSKDEKHMNITSWVTLINQSGTTYKNAQLQLVAGDVNQVSSGGRRDLPGISLLSKSRSKAPQMREESLFEYHLYSLDQSTTLLNNQTKQVALFTASQVGVKKEYVLQGGNYYYKRRYPSLGKKQKVAVFLKVSNKKENQLGVPLPKGIFRIYKPDQRGNNQFVGEDNIDHTPLREELYLKLGNAFDITAKKTQTSFQKRSGYSSGGNIYRSSYKYQLKNAKKEKVTVLVKENIPGDWSMLEESLSHQKLHAHLVMWSIEIPGKTQRELTFQVEVKQ